LESLIGKQGSKRIRREKTIGRHDCSHRKHWIEQPRRRKRDRDLIIDHRARTWQAVNEMET